MTFIASLLAVVSTVTLVSYWESVKIMMTSLRVAAVLAITTVVLMQRLLEFIPLLTFVGSNVPTLKSTVILNLVEEDGWLFRVEIQSLQQISTEDGLNMKMALASLMTNSGLDL